MCKSKMPLLRKGIIKELSVAFQLFTFETDINSVLKPVNEWQRHLDSKMVYQFFFVLFFVFCFFFWGGGVLILF